MLWAIVTATLLEAAAPPWAASVAAGPELGAGQVVDFVADLQGGSLRVEFTRSLGSHFSLGVSAHVFVGSLRLEPGPALANHVALYGQYAIRAEVLGSGALLASYRIAPSASAALFASLRVGWFGFSLGHGPEGGLSVGAEFRPDAQAPVWLGPELSVSLAAHSKTYAVSTPESRGYPVAVSPWGARWDPLWTVSLGLRVRAAP